MLEILDLPVKDKEIFIFPETKETSKSVTSLSVKLLRLRMINIPQNNFTCKSNPDPVPPPNQSQHQGSADHKFLTPIFKLDRPVYYVICY